MLKKYIAIITLVPIVFFCSCAKKEYLDTISCGNITDTLTEEILGSDMYAEYSENDVKLIFNNSELFDSCSVIYSLSSDDIGEVGVFHAKNSDNAKMLLKEITKYIEEVKDEKNSFVNDYMPQELDKLNYADTRQFGNYVIYTILSSDTSDEVFMTAKNMLSE